MGSRVVLLATHAGLWKQVLMLRFFSLITFFLGIAHGIGRNARLSRIGVRGLQMAVKIVHMQDEECCGGAATGDIIRPPFCAASLVSATSDSLTRWFNYRWQTNGNCSGAIPHGIPFSDRILYVK